jgi:hypothetical protein
MADERGQDVRQLVLAMAEDLEVERHSEAIAERAQARRRQLERGAVNIIPLPRVATQPFRTELTVERNSLFVSSSYKGDHFVRESVVRHPESGEEVIRRVTVGKTGKRGKARGVLTQAHQDVFYQLLRFWGDQGHRVAEVDGTPHGILSVSGYELVTSVSGGDDSAKAYQRVRDLVRDLAAVPVLLENEYTWQKLVDREEFTLLEKVYWRERAVDQNTGRPSAKGRSEVRIHLSPSVTTGFLDQNIKVLLGAPYQALRDGGKRKGEIACLLYPWLDLQLSRKDCYQAKLTTLITRFALAPCRFKSKRREKFNHALGALEGQLIQQGKYRLRLSVEDAADGGDFVLVARRVPVG